MYVTYDRMDCASRTNAVADLITSVQRPLSHHGVGEVYASAMSCRWALEDLTSRILLLTTFLRPSSLNKVVLPFVRLVVKDNEAWIRDTFWNGQYVSLNQGLRVAGADRADYTAMSDKNGQTLTYRRTRGSLDPCVDRDANASGVRRTPLQVTLDAQRRILVRILSGWDPLPGGPGLGTDLALEVAVRVPPWEHLFLTKVPREDVSLFGRPVWTCKEGEIVGILLEVLMDVTPGKEDVETHVQELLYALKTRACAAHFKASRFERARARAQATAARTHPSECSAGRTVVVCDERTAVAVRKAMRGRGTALSMRSAAETFSWGLDPAALSDVLFVRPASCQNGNPSVCLNVKVDRVVVLTNTAPLPIPTDAAWLPINMSATSWSDVTRLSHPFDMQTLVDRSYYSPCVTLGGNDE